MLNSCLYNLLDYILPCSDKPKHDIHRLEVQSACKIMENTDHTLKILPHIPASTFETLLQSVIYKSYIKFINNYNQSTSSFLRGSLCVEQKYITFPESLGLLVLNWPHEELVLIDQLPSLDPPVERFPSRYIPLTSQRETICQVEDMLTMFHKFCNNLIEFIIKSIFNYVPLDTHTFSCTLKRLDVSGLGRFHSREYVKCFLTPDEIIKGMRSSSVNTFGHKIEILADAEFGLGDKKGFELFSRIVEESFNPDAGISVFFKKITTSCFNPNAQFPSDFFDVLAIGGCEYLQISWMDFDEYDASNICINLPELVGISLPSATNMENLDFLIELEDLEQLNFSSLQDSNLICPLFNCMNMISKGLKYLDLSHSGIMDYIEDLANNHHIDTLLELDISSNRIRNDLDAVRLTMLCKKLKNIKILKMDDCALGTLSLNSFTNLVSAIKDCASLEYLSMRQNPLSLELLSIIIDDLALKNSLRYLSLDLPKMRSQDRLVDVLVPNNEYVTYLNSLCKTYHEQINRFRNSQIYISWYFYER